MENYELIKKLNDTYNGLKEEIERSKTKDSNMENTIANISSSIGAINSNIELINKEILKLNNALGGGTGLTQITKANISDLTDNISQWTNDSGYLSNEEIPNASVISRITQDNISAWNNKSDSNHKHSTSDIVGFPTSLSEFENDAEFLTKRTLQVSNANIVLSSANSGDILINKIVREEVEDSPGEYIERATTICKAVNNIVYIVEDNDDLTLVKNTLKTSISSTSSAFIEYYVYDILNKNIYYINNDDVTDWETESYDLSTLVEGTFAFNDITKNLYFIDKGYKIYKVSNEGSNVLFAQVKNKPVGNEGQVYRFTTDGSSDVKASNLLEKANLVDSMFDLEDSKSKPVSFADVFNNWKRFSHLDDSNDANPEEKNAWIYDEENDKVICTVNSATYIGFISNEKYDNYSLDVTLSSSNDDDDMIGVIIAFAIDSNGKQHTLSAIRCASSQDHLLVNGSAYRWAIVYDYKLSTNKLISTSNIEEDTLGWKTRGSTNVKIERKGSIITAYTSSFNSTDLLEQSKLIVDLDSDPVLEIFKSACPYGYSCFSQNQSSFSNIKFTGGLDSAIFDATTGRVLKWENGAWAEDTSKNIINEIGKGKFVYNESTGKLFYIDTNGKILPLTSILKNIMFKSELGEKTGITGTMAQNDGWRIVGYDEGSDNGVLEIATMDNGTEEIVFRQYTNIENKPYSDIKRTLKILDKNGDTIIPGTLYIGSDTLETYITNILKNKGLIS